MKSYKQIALTLVSGILLLASTGAKAIVNGEHATDETPWMVFVVGSEQSLPIQNGGCGGTLVHPEWVLTAFECVTDFESNRWSSDSSKYFDAPTGIRERSLDVIVGSRNLLDPNARRITVERIVVDPQSFGNDDYTGPLGQLQHGAVLLKLTEPVDLPVVTLVSSDVDLDPSNSSDAQNATVYGWGYTELDPWGPIAPQNYFSTELMQASIDFQRLESDPRYDRYVLGFNHSRSSCWGDMGGPVMMEDPMTGERVQVAVSLSGQTNCFSVSDNRPGDKREMALRLAPRINWVNSTLNEVALDEIDPVGSLTVECYEKLCVIDTGDVRLNGNAPHLATILVMDYATALGDNPDGWIGVFSGPKVELSVEPGQKMVAGVFYYDEDGNYGRGQVLIDRDQIPNSDFSGARGEIKIPDCTALKCYLYLANRYGLVSQTWSVDGQEVSTERGFSHAFAAAGRYNVTYSGVAYDGSEYRVERLIRVFGDGRKARLYEQAEGAIGAGQRAFGLGKEGRAYAKGDRVLVILNANDGTRLWLQKLTPGVGWSRVESVNVKITANRKAVIRYDAEESTKYRVAIKAVDQATRWYITRLDR